jgi:peptide/nickel transport system substrate-binding protein
MKRNTLMLLVGMVIIASMVLAACQPTPAPVVEEPVVEEPVVEEPVEEPVVEEPTAVPTEVPTPEPVRTTRKGGWLDEIVVSVVDSASAVTQIQAGAIDIYAAGLSSDSLPEIEAAGLDYAQSNGLYYELTFNTYGPFFDQSTGAVNPFVYAKAREALNWLVDRDYINREVYNGGALPKFWSIITNMPDYTKMAETVRRLEAKYAYNPELAKAQMDEVMLGIEGVTIEDGKYMFGGEQVTLIFLIRSDSDKTRVPIGDYVANQLESIGFAVDRQYKTSTEASPIWVGGNVADGLWHIYTGAWSATIIDRDEGDNFEFFDTPQSAYGFSSTWQAFTSTALGTPYGDLADKLAYNKFTSIEERDAALAEMLEMALEESIHVWLIDGKNFTPYREGVDVTYDLAAGVDGSMIWPYTIRLSDQEGGQLKWGAPDLFVDPWNPIAGSNWAFDQAIGRATWGEAYMIDPHTGLYWPQRFERAEITVQEGLPVGKTLDWVDLSFEPEIAVPEDAIVDWDAENQAFITAAEKFPEGTTARVKSVVYYPADLFDTVKWHDGSPIDLGDMLYAWIISLDMGKEASPIYDEAYAANAEAILANYKGFKIISENPLVVESYSDAYQTDAELDVVTSLWPSFSYGEAPWHILAMGARGDEAGELAFSGDKADAKSTETATVEWFSQIGGPSLEIVSKWLDTSIEEAYIPYANVLSAYITPEEAAARYENAKAFFAEYGHYNIGTGPYILSEVFLTEKVATLIQFADHADLSDKWSQFGDPKVATLEVDGEGSVVLGGEFAFDVFVTFQGEAYPADEIKEVKGLLYDATGQIVKVLDGVLVEDGYYTITVPADVAATMEAGASKIEAVVVPYTVAIPSFVAFEFVTVK